MRRFFTATVIAVVAAATTTMAGPTRPRLDWGKHVNPHACDASGAPVINVTMKVTNDADSGQAGNYWAFDTFNKQIQVFDQGDGSYCAVVRFTGQFVAQAGQMSPGNGGVLSDNVKGTVEGGYIATFEGSLLARPLWRTRGNVGTLDYGCDISGVCSGPGYIDWVSQYFTAEADATFDQPWWGWIYHAGKNGTWVNSSDGNAGDIK